jgi:hypothetical protein
MNHTSLALAALTFFATAPALAQVHYHDDGRPWRQRANAGPDQEVPGWYYNLGRTGLRVELVADAPTRLVVRHVFEGSPAHKKVQVGDHIVGAGGAEFVTPHQNGYGVEVFGARGPISDFADALERCQGEDGRLALQLARDGKRLETTLRIGKDYGVFAPTYPADCKKSERIADELLTWLLKQQQQDGSFGDPVVDLWAPLALLASGKKQHLAAVQRNVRFHKETTKARDEGSLINWRYMTAAIVIAEYHLLHPEPNLVKELEEIHEFLLASQYVSLEQLKPSVKESHPDSWPKDARQQHGGWGHNPGFEGYGPIAMLTGEGAIAFGLMQRAGVRVDRERHDAAFQFLARGTGKNGYVWYADDVGGRDWADMGRTGAAATALRISPWNDPEHAARAKHHAQLIGEHPESFPDTHGSPILGMGFAALGALADPAAYRRLFDANRYWFTLAQCTDGTFYYQPNRDNAGYGRDSRLSASAVTAFLLLSHRGNLVVTGRGE